MSDTNGAVLNGTEVHQTSGDDSGVHSGSARGGARGSARTSSGAPFQRKEGGSPDDLVQLRIPRWMRDQLHAERERIEPNADSRRSGEFYAAKVFEHGLDWLRSIQPVVDPLA